MLLDKIKVDISFILKLFLFSPAVVFLVIGMFYLPWGAPTAPAWVQAIGSIAAVCAAFFISNHQHAVAERVKKAEERARQRGFAQRLVFFTLEVNEVISKVIASDNRRDTADADEQVADVLQVMLNRLNLSFDDDIDVTRTQYYFRLRLLLAGCRFTLLATRKLGADLRRTVEIAMYQETSAQIHSDCTAHARDVCHSE